ncbi:hypothetical protein K3495_g16679 [Podosphaera aphanis]|nr:hypothetical protein K3495_g16679 [Podosphaera aphanis]
MGGMKIDVKQLSAFLASLNSKGKGKANGKFRNAEPKPSAPWRSDEEFQILREKGVCIRCEKPGHISKFCRKFGPPKQSTQISSLQELNNFLEASNSGKD